MAAPRHNTDKDASARIKSLRAAWMRHGIDDPAAEVEALSRTQSRPDNDDNSTDAASDAPDQQTVDSIGKALARLSDESPCAAAKIVVDCTFDDRLSGGGVAYALGAIARACPERLTAAILDKAAAAPAQCPDLHLASVIKRAALHADSRAILDTLFAALAAGGADHRPALCMIKAMVAHNHDAAHDYELASQTLDRLVSYARARGTDTDSITNKDRDPCLQSAVLINHLLSPPPEVDAERALQNLKLFPSLKKSFGSPWLESALREDRTPHPLVSCLSHRLNEDLKHLLAGPPGEPAAERRIRESKLECGRGPAKALAFIDRALALFEDSGLVAATYVKHMRNPDQFWDTVSEIALVAPFVADGCKVELEPSMGRKRLDAAITLGQQRVLVEVLSVHMCRQLDLFGVSRKVSRRRLAGKILAKAAAQLPAPGTCGNPVVVAVDTSRSEAVPNDAEGYVLGPKVHEVTIDQRTGETIDYRVARDIKECMHRQDPCTDSISAVVCFEPAMSCDLTSTAKGRVISNPHARVPLDAAALEALRRVLWDVPSDEERPEGGAP